MKSTNTRQLKKALGIGFGIAILIGGTIGVGILRTPGPIAGMLNNNWLIIACWALGGVYVLIGAGCYAELATMLPKAGGSYNYVKRAFGDYAGFIIGWFDYLTNAIAPAFLCIVISEYIVAILPVFKNQTTLISISFLIAFTLLHAQGIKSGSITQQITSVIKVLFFVGFITACFMYSGVQLDTIEKESSIFETGVIIGFFKSLQMVLGSFDGWNAGCFFAEEDENPVKNIPKALYTGAAIVITIYVVINIAFLHVLPASAIANSPLAASDVAKIIFGDQGAFIVTLIAIFSIISILNAFMMITPRILYGMSRDGFFVQKGSIVNKGGTPIVSLLVSASFALVLILIGSFEVLFSLATFMSIIVWGFAYCALIKLRNSEPNLPRPYKSWGYPWTTFIMIGCSIALFIGFAFSDQKSLIIIGAITFVSYPIFLTLNKLNNNDTL